MSFWSGLARGFKDADEKKEREAAAEAEEQRYLGDVERQERWRAQDIEIAAAARAADIALRRDQLAWEREQFNRTQGLEEKKFELEVTESEFSREAAAEAAAQQQANWDKAFDYNATRDAIGDEQWQSEQDRIREDSAEARRQWQETFDFSKSEADAAAERWLKQFGFDQDRALSEDEWRDAMHLYAVSRDAVSDAQWNKQFDYTQAQAEAAEARFRATHNLAVDAQLTREQQFEAEMEWRQQQAATAAEQWEAEQALRESADERAGLAISIQLQEQLIELGAGRPGSADADGPSVSDGVAAVTAIRAELEEAGGIESLPEADQEFFNTMAGNPAAAAGVMSFVLEQREAGNDFEITRLPQVINIVGVVEARGEEAYKKFQKDFAEGNVNLSDPEAYLDGVRALRSYKPAEVLFVQSEPVRNIQDQEKMFKAWEQATIQSANATLASMDPESPEYTELHAALKATESANSRIAMRGLNDLWASHGRSSAELLGLDNNNTFLKPFFASDVDTAPTGETPEPVVTEPVVEEPTVTEPVAEPTVAEPTPPREELYETYPDVDRDLFFDSQDEALAVMGALPDEDRASIEFVVVDGVKYANNLYQGPAEEPAEGPVVETTEEPTEEPSTSPEIDEVKRQLNHVLENEGIDPAEFERFLEAVDKVEGFQEITNYETLITIYNRLKAKGNSW